MKRQCDISTGFMRLLAEEWLVPLVGGPLRILYPYTENALTSLLSLKKFIIA